MKRRDFVTWGALGTWGVPALVSAQTKTLRFGHLHAPDSAIHVGLMRAADLIAQSTSGRIKLEVYPSSQLGSSLEMQKQMVEGALDFIIESAAAMASYQPSLSLLEAPFISRDWAHLSKMFESGFGKREFGDLEKRRGIVRVGAWYYGQRHFTTYSVPLATPADAKDLKLRVPEAPLYLDMVKVLGATPVPMTLSKVHASLQSRAVDGQENPLPVIFNNKFFEVQKFLNLTGHITLALMPLINTKTWNGLHFKDRDLIRQALEEGARINEGLTRGKEAELLKQLKTLGMYAVESDRPAFQKVMERLYTKYEDGWGVGAWQAMKILKA